MLSKWIERLSLSSLQAKALKPFRRSPKESTHDRGMSIIEIIIVISLIGMVMVLVATRLTKQRDEALIDAASIKMSKLEQSLQVFRVHNLRYPTTDQGLNSLVTDPGNAKKWRGPYTEAQELNDPWEQPMRYESDGSTYKIYSDGPDGQSGTSDDISYPKEAEAAPGAATE